MSARQALRALVFEVDELDPTQRKALVDVVVEAARERYCVDENDIIICLPGKCTCGRRA